jgi:hypothetical protein
MRRPRIVMILLLSALCATAQAQWVWRDAAGQIHASDLPPPKGTPDKSIVQRPAVQARIAPPASAPASAAASAAGGVDAALEARRKKAAEDQLAQRKAQDEKNAAVRAENCQRAREQLRSLDSGQRMSRTLPNGEREILDDAQRAAESQRVRSIVSSECA